MSREIARMTLMIRMMRRKGHREERTGREEPVMENDSPKPLTQTLSLKWLP
jgi:hypothetical protein